MNRFRCKTERKVSTYIHVILNDVQFTEMEQVVIEDREKMKKLQQQQEEIRSAIKVRSSITSNLDLRFNVYTMCCDTEKAATLVPAASGLVERLHGPSWPQQFWKTRRGQNGKEEEVRRKGQEEEIICPHLQLVSF